MNILYIENGFICEQDIINAFDMNGYDVHLFPAVLQNSEEQEEYLQLLLMQVKELKPLFLFSTNFIPFVSLACGVLKIPYVSWIVDGYHPEHKNITIRNEWNIVFAADSVLYKELKEIGVMNSYFLPLAAPDYMKENTDVTELPIDKYEADISFMGSVLEDKKRNIGPLSYNNDLKDATKGYLAGCVACQLQTKKLPPMGEKLPSYVWEDLKNIYPPKMQNSLESVSKYYTNTYFNDYITYDSRIFYLKNLVNIGKYKKIHHYSRYEINVDKGIKYCGWADYYKELPLVAKNSKINIVLTHYNLQAGISTAAWGIMAAGGFLIANEQADYSILEPTKVVLFGDIHEMRQKVEYYYGHEEERMAVANVLSKEISQKHTYKHRIEEMLSIVLEK